MDNAGGSIIKPAPMNWINVCTLAAATLLLLGLPSTYARKAIDDAGVAEKAAEPAQLLSSSRPSTHNL